MRFRVSLAIATLIVFLAIAEVGPIVLGDWDSQGEPGVTKVEYDYAYKCQIEISDRKAIDQKGRHYIHVADFTFTANQLEIDFKELDWKVVLHEYMNDQLAEHDVPYPFYEGHLSLYVSPGLDSYTKMDDMAVAEVSFSVKLNDRLVTVAYDKASELRNEDKLYVSARTNIYATKPNREFYNVEAQVICQKKN